MFKKAYAKVVGSTTALATVLSVAVSSAYAQLPTSAPYGFNDIPGAVSAVMGLVFFFALILVLVYLVWGGIQWITAGGDKAGLEAARGKITGAVIGLIVVAVAFAIYNLLLNFIPNARNITFT